MTNYIPWPILWFNLDYLEEEQLIIHRKQETKTSASSSLSSIYEVSDKGQTVMAHKDEYVEKYPFVKVDNDNYGE